MGWVGLGTSFAVSAQPYTGVVTRTCIEVQARRPKNALCRGKCINIFAQTFKDLKAISEQGLSTYTL